MRNTMKNNNLSTLKIFSFSILFIVVSVVTFISMNYQTETFTTTTMTEASLPVVVMQTQEGTLFNELHGYTMTMDQSLLNQPITPLPTDKKLNIVVDTYQQSITGISYKIRDSKDMSLIE